MFLAKVLPSYDYKHSIMTWLIDQFRSRFGHRVSASLRSLSSHRCTKSRDKEMPRACLNQVQPKFENFALYVLSALSLPTSNAVVDRALLNELSENKSHKPYANGFIR